MGHPTSIGPYAIDALLGEGGMGRVYRGRSAQGAPVAIKVLLTAQAKPEAQQRLVREAKALGKLQHPRIVEVMDAGVVQGLPWFAMRYVEGESLEERLERAGPLDPDDVVDLAHQLAEALEAAHAEGILHRDLKPGNVLCTRDGDYVLTDFGLAKDLEVEASMELSRSGHLQGTPGFWAPEQAAGAGKRATKATDVYLLGATLFAALTGGPPFDGNSLVELLVATQEQPPPPPSSLRPHVPPALERVILRCLEKSPGRRFPSARAVSAALASGAGAPRRLWPAGLLALALLVGAGLLLASADPTAPPEAQPPQALPSTADAAPPREESEPRAEPEPRTTPGPRTEPKPAANASSLEALRERTLEAIALAKTDERTAIEQLSALAAEGYAPAMNNLGVIYSQKRGPENMALAVEWLRKAANLNNGPALRNLGQLYWDGNGVPEDPARAVRLFVEGAEAGDLRSLLYYGEALWDGRGIAANPERAVGIFRRTADEGIARSMLFLGDAYLQGRGVPSRDPGEALRWYRRGAELGDPPCMFNVGLLHFRGQDVPENKPEGVRWFRKAAEAGDVSSMANLGIALINGEGVPKDAAEAYRWTRAAAEGGHPSSHYRLALMLTRGDGVAPDPAEALRWFERGWDLGDRGCALALGMAHEQGSDVPRDPERAVEWYRRALDSENPRVQQMARAGIQRLEGR